MCRGRRRAPPGRRWTARASRSPSSASPPRGSAARRDWPWRASRRSHGCSPRRTSSSARRHFRGRPSRSTSPVRCSGGRSKPSVREGGVWGVVLAAGASTRFGSPKQALLLEPVLERVHASAVDDVVVVLGAHEIDTTVRTVVCPDWELGPGASLRCGFAALPDQAGAAVVVPADGPRLAPPPTRRGIAGGARAVPGAGPALAPAAIDRVIEEWRAERGPVVAATYGGIRLHPVLIARE